MKPGEISRIKLTYSTRRQKFSEVNKVLKMNRKTEINIELKETLAYSKRDEKFEAHCPQCKKLVEMATPTVAAILTLSNEREIYRQVESGEIHFIEIDRILICLNSLTEFKKNV